MKEPMNNKKNPLIEKINLKNNVKSLNIIKHIFSNLPENKKLNLIINNKHIQKKLNIDLEYYKKRSNRYKIQEKNGKGKEYTLYSNKLIFKGEYKNKKKNGKGKGYNNNGQNYQVMKK